MSSAALVGGGDPAWGGGIFEILFILIVFVCILFLAYVATRFIAKRASGRMKSRHIEIVDTLSVGADAQLLVVKVGGEVFLASKSQKQISLLTKLALTSLDIQESAAQTPGFADSFRTVLEGKLSRARPQRDERDERGEHWERGGERGGADEANTYGGADGGAYGASGGTTESGSNGGSSSFRGNIDRLKDYTDSGAAEQPKKRGGTENTDI
ncbi:MAG: flagellar biosynthetic protein FliO [Oscillospiraceae bacterium]|nr:flagellar biosynthetic protein FliO [Oscillospiraceae bacterium]